MTAIEEGSICIKTAGRKAGEKVVVINKVDNTFVEIIGPTIKKKRCNIAHLFPTNKKIKISKNISQEEVKKNLE